MKGPTMNTVFKPRRNNNSAPQSKSRHWLPAIVLMSAFLQSAYAGTPPPAEQMAVSTAAVDSAARAGATELAPTEMAIARDKLAQAKAAMTDGKDQRALMLAEAAQVDALLAEAKARNAQAGKAATELRESNRVLRQEIERSAK